MKPIYLFYEEPETDRWIKYDRYPRRIIRRIVRGPEKIGGVKKWFVNLMKGLELLNIPYKVNDYKTLRKDPSLVAFVIGKPHVVEKIPDQTKIIYGPGIASHPSDNDFWDKKNIIHVLASCQWFADVYKRDMPKVPVSVWPSGIETEVWKPLPNKEISNHILVYDKIRWKRDVYEDSLLKPILQAISESGIKTSYIKYGDYEEKDFEDALKTVDAMIFLCEHETQGFAYLQALSSDVPILAWNRKGYWQDPMYYPERVKFKEVSSVPYWDDRCGMQFEDIEGFHTQFPKFCERYKNKEFQPRQYVLDNLTLEKCSSDYIKLVEQIIAQNG
jgi:hypothetical protein